MWRICWFRVVLSVMNLLLSIMWLVRGWSRFCGWSLGNWRCRSLGGWYGRVWSCGGSCRRSRFFIGVSCRFIRRVSSGRFSLCSGCRVRFFSIRRGVWSWSSSCWRDLESWSSSD